MKIFNTVTTYVINLSEKDFKNYLIGVLAGITSVTLLSFYFIYARSSKKVKNIRQLHSLVAKSTATLSQNEAIQWEEDRIQELLSQNKDFNIKSYFEQFCREHHIVPEANWDTIVNPLEGNEKFEEVILAATFKNETTKTLVTLLDALDKNEIVYLSELVIKKQEDKISFDLVIATKKLKRVLEE